MRRDPLRPRRAFLLLALIAALSGPSCARKDAGWFVGEWAGTYRCDFPSWSSVKAPAAASPVRYLFQADGTCVRSEPGRAPSRSDTMHYAVDGSTMIWEQGDEASERIEIMSDDAFVLVYDNGRGGTCRTTLRRPDPGTP